ncbi:MAG: hypothetical protein M0Z59_09215 [Nitrospiraceae bacterium]|nr:hypothetical protein [Nitrospiraceae bacterium]
MMEIYGAPRQIIFIFQEFFNPSKTTVKKSPVCADKKKEAAKNGLFLTGGNESGYVVENESAGPVQVSDRNGVWDTRFIQFDQFSHP